MRHLINVRALAWMLVMTLPLWLGNCKKDDDNNPATPAGTIEGSYKITALKANPKVLGLYDDLIAASKALFSNSTCLTDITITFKTGGDATTDNPSSCQSIPVPVSTFTGIDATSKWSRSGDKLTVTKGDGTKTEYTIVSTGSTTTLQWQGALNYPVANPALYTYTMDLKKQ